MRWLTPFILLLASLTFMTACSKKNPEPPALGDHTGVDDNNPNPGSKKAGEKVLSLGNIWGDIFRIGPKGTLYVRNSSKTFKVYKPNDKGVFADGLAFPGDPWEASADLYYLGVAQGVETVMISNVPPAGLFRFDVKSDGLLDIHPTTKADDPWPNNFGFWYGDGWDKFDFIPFKGKFVFQIAHDEGESLLRSDFGKFTDDFSTWNRPATLKRDDTGLKFSKYKAAMAMGNNLLIINNEGDLMSYAVDDAGAVAGGKKIGTGWQVYKRFAATGNDLLALDSKGDVYRYKIDLAKTDNNADEP